jgi:hypothetical protein
LNVESPLRSRGKRSALDGSALLLATTHRPLSSRWLVARLPVRQERCCRIRAAHSASDLCCLVSIGPYETEAGSKGIVHCPDLAICPHMVTEQRRSACSILLRVPPWQTITDHGRVCCAITSLTRAVCCPFGFGKPSHHSSVTLPPVLLSNATISWSRHTAAPAVSDDPSHMRGDCAGMPGLRVTCPLRS